jgi:hypothetical protein
MNEAESAEEMKSMSLFGKVSEAEQAWEAECKIRVLLPDTSSCSETPWWETDLLYTLLLRDAVYILMRRRGVKGKGVDGPDILARFQLELGSDAEIEFLKVCCKKKLTYVFKAFLPNDFASFSCSVFGVHFIMQLASMKVLPKSLLDVLLWHRHFEMMCEDVYGARAATVLWLACFDFNQRTFASFCGVSSRTHAMLKNKSVVLYIAILLQQSEVWRKGSPSPSI